MFLTSFFLPSKWSLHTLPQRALCMLGIPSPSYLQFRHLSVLFLMSWASIWSANLYLQTNFLEFCLQFTELPARDFVLDVVQSHQVSIGSEVDENQGRDMSESGRDVLRCSESQPTVLTLVRDGTGWQPCQSPAASADHEQRAWVFEYSSHLWRRW